MIISEAGGGSWFCWCLLSELGELVDWKTSLFWFPVIVCCLFAKHGCCHLVWPEYFFEILDFFCENVGKKMRKRSKLCKKNENVCSEIQFLGFLLLNILDQIFKISTIAESLVTLFLICCPAMRYHLSCKTYHFHQIIDWLLFFQNDQGSCSLEWF